jgi:sec-independent protein translocase protein TatA
MPTEWIWVLVVIVVLFGASRLPLMGRNVGLGIKEFKKGISEGSRDDDRPGEPKPAAGATDERRERGTTA